ncbi:unnamed protein product [Rotaria sp. Silwood2]|nr:unnamed protein product [Rotaria sp. Silwood2]CAF2744552.1 unnamed protein product [Rotaria sp. Silwood2]CAF2982594.1 unnamed protein product [Rotaria sp. Silwood2]CAF3310210.1 unnamed protein product [Rotaria sp. Silwood2]CAF3954832.1 unnamed protein product [Rotaria sp. Silwood2]
MVKWVVETQQAGITDTMRINMLSTLRTLIDTYGSSKRYQICADLRNWLNATYGGEWAVVIGETGTFASVCPIFDQQYLSVTETDLGWTVFILKVSR